MPVVKLKLLEDGSIWAGEALPEIWTLSNGTTIRVNPGTEPTLPQGVSVVEKRTIGVQDEIYEHTEERWRIRASILKKLASNMGLREPRDEREVYVIFTRFRLLPYPERVRLGVWGPGTFEGKVQELMRQGMSFDEAVERVRAER